MLLFRKEMFWIILVSCTRIQFWIHLTTNKTDTMINKNVNGIKSDDQKKKSLNSLLPPFLSRLRLSPCARSNAGYRTRSRKKLSTDKNTFHCRKHSVQIVVRVSKNGSNCMLQYESPHLHCRNSRFLKMCHSFLLQFDGTFVSDGIVWIVESFQILSMRFVENELVVHPSNL